MMGEMLRLSHSPILPPHFHRFRQEGSINRISARLFRNRSDLGSSLSSSSAQGQQLHHNWLLKPTTTGTRVVSDSKKDIEIQPVTSGGDGGLGGGADGEGGGAGGGGGGRGGDNNDSNETEGGSGENDKIKKMGMSMSQKLTLAYAVLVAVGGVMGYLKSGSKKSLAAGGLSAMLLWYTYTELPTRPVFASSIGFGISAALLVVMGLRFKKSGKIFPAGVVSFVSFVMSGGYIHGILRSLH